MIHGAEFEKMPSFLMVKIFFLIEKFNIPFFLRNFAYIIMYNR